jgi:hypothetical protein
VVTPPVVVTPPPVVMPPPPVRPVVPTGEKRIAFVVGNRDNLGRGDDELLLFMESLNFVVDVVDDSERSRDFRDDGLVVISSSVQAGTIRDEWSNVNQPVLVMDSDIFADMSMTSNRAQDAGTLNSRQIDIVDAKHPIAAGLSGRVNISRNNAQLNFGAPGPEAIIIARIGNDARRATIFAYEPGAALVANNNQAARTARNRRVAFFATDQITDNLDSDGQLLMEAALVWTWSGQSIAPGQ